MLNELIEKRKKILAESEQHKNRRNELNALASKWARERNTLNNQTREYVENAAPRGIHVMIAGAGWAAHLAGVVAAHTTLPVIGVPIDSSPLQGMDSLLSTVQMPPGIPVATVSIGKGGATNAAVLAAEILALKFPEIAERLKAYREGLTRKALEASQAKL